jgi:nucleoside-diphosphate-sugar epimerase
MRVCVTGGLGFVGVHLCRLLAGRGNEVACVDRLSGRYGPGSGEDAAPGLESLGVDVLRAGAEEPLAADLMRDCDAVVHLAALPGVRTRHSERALWDGNVAVTAAVLRAAESAGARFVLASSSSVYGEPETLPTPEDAPRRPLNAYAASKKAAEDLCFAAAARGADAVVVRPFTIYGPGQRPDMAFAAWSDRMLRDEPVDWCAPPGTKRDFTYVGDAARGFAAALDRGEAGRAYNLGGAGPVGLEAALELLERELGRSARRRIVGSRTAEASITAACGRRSARELGWVATTPLDRGLAAQAVAGRRAPALAV